MTVRPSRSEAPPFESHAHHPAPGGGPPTSQGSNPPRGVERSRSISRSPTANPPLTRSEKPGTMRPRAATSGVTGRSRRSSCVYPREVARSPMVTGLAARPSSRGPHRSTQAVSGVWGMNGHGGAVLRRAVAAYTPSKAPAFGGRRSSYGSERTRARAAPPSRWSRQPGGSLLTCLAPCCVWMRPQRHTYWATT